MTFNCQRGKENQGGLNRTPQANSPVISEYTNLKKLLVVGREKRSILQDSVKCVLPIRSEVKLDTFANSALFCFTKDLVLRNTIQWRTTRLSTCIFCSLGLRSLIYSVKPWVRICYGVEHSKSLKHPVTRGYLIKRPARRQCVNKGLFLLMQGHTQPFLPKISKFNVQLECWI